MVALTDEDGELLETVEYDVYGSPSITQHGSNPPTGNRYLFTGREYDFETGLYHYRARAYSPSLGRFLQRDPVPAMNLYEYVRNNPTVFTDPEGTDPEFCKCINLYAYRKWSKWAWELYNPYKFYDFEEYIGMPPLKPPIKAKTSDDIIGAKIEWNPCYEYEKGKFCPDSPTFHTVPKIEVEIEVPIKWTLLGELEQYKFRKQVPERQGLFTTASMGAEIGNYTNLFYTRFQVGKGAARLFLGGEECKSCANMKQLPITFEVVK